MNGVLLIIVAKIIMIIHEIKHLTIIGLLELGLWF